MFFAGWAGASALIFFFVFIPVPASRSADTGYAGAEKCMPCHLKIYDDWQHSGHSRILRPSEDPEVATIPLPEGYNRRDISYIVGGYKWKALFLDMNGYVVTSTLFGKGRNQYNLKSRKWVDYRPGDLVPYDCGRCHTTGYKPEGHNDGLEGIVGTWKFEGVQCEACHGPGSKHVESASKADIMIDRDVCYGCHETKPLDEIPVKGNFLAPYTTVNQLFKSGMSGMKCPGCHDPHMSAEISIKKSCEECHEKIAKVYNGSYKKKLGILCIDCHMPPAGLVAEGDPKTYHGDLKSHIFRIDHHASSPFMVEDGQRVNPGYLSVDYVCMRCHDVFEKRSWAVSTATIAHRLKATTNVKIMRLQMAIAYAGIFFAAAALLSAFSLKKWLWPAQDVKKVLSIHKHSAWITFALYVFESTLCIYFHFPLSDPSSAVNLGWFLIHPVIGITGLVFYTGKIVTVRKFKKGWGTQGFVWGSALFVFWLFQFATVILAFYEILRV